MNNSIQYIKANQAMVAQIRDEWSQVVADHMVVENGFSIVAVADHKIVALIGVYWSELPRPLEGTREAYINIIEVLPEFRNMGIATELVQRSVELAREGGAYQLRAWSSDDKIQALPLWRKLGFALCPADNPWHQGLKGFFVGYVL